MDEAREPYSEVDQTILISSVTDAVVELEHGSEFLIVRQTARPCCDRRRMTSICAAVRGDAYPGAITAWWRPEVLQGPGGAF